MMLRPGTGQGDRDEASRSTTDTEDEQGASSISDAVSWSADGSANEGARVSGVPGTPCLLRLDVLLPGQSEAQPVELFFDPGWLATAHPVCVRFNDAGKASIRPPQATAAREDGRGDAPAGLLVVQCEPVDVGRLGHTGCDTRKHPASAAPASRAGQSWRRLGRFFRIVDMALYTATLVRLFAAFDKARLCPRTDVPQNCTISLHETINNATYQFVDAAVSMHEPFALANQSLGIFDPNLT
jgi:hypothetical protein